ncbi:hypothetical protein LSTR_LSTR002471 [Laodelphax striatellus]|uniref:BRCA1-associated RING domain protein 1 n=1 Tax=Laodelphax striatellus TaxID=195883 RepID=A0A482X3G1_LAOST|nr:hypothetical protein LSTR_LSTR002471 [Laodelphax striatellus]
MEAVLKKFDDALKCGVCNQSTKRPFTTGSCSHFFCQDCLLGLVESICPKCSVSFYPDKITLDTTVGSIFHEINKITKIFKSIRSPPNSLLDGVIHDIEHGGNTSNGGSIKIAEKENKKGSIYTKIPKSPILVQNKNKEPNESTKKVLKDFIEISPVFETNETHSVDMIGNSQSPMKKTPLCFSKQKIRHVSNDGKGAYKGNTSSENNKFVAKTIGISPNKSSDSDVDFVGFPKVNEELDDSWLPINSTPQNMENERMKTRKKSFSNRMADVEKIGLSKKIKATDKKNSDRVSKENCLNDSNDRIEKMKNNSSSGTLGDSDRGSIKRTDKKDTDMSNEDSLNNFKTQLKKRTPVGKLNSTISKESVKVRKSYTKDSKIVCQFENDSSEIIPATPQDATIGLVVDPVSARGRKHSTSLNVNSTKRRDSVKRNKKGETPLQAACAKGNLAEVERLIREGSDPNTKDFAGWTPLHEAVMKGNIQIVEALVKAGANINTPGHFNITPLLEAVLQNNNSVVSFLLRNGADKSLRSLYNYRPLDCAQGEEMINLLNQVQQPDGVTAKEASTNYSMPDPFCLCAINLNADQSQMLRDFCIKFNLKCVESLRAEVTHAIVVTQESNVCKSDVNILKCLANGTAVISFNSIEHNVKSNEMTRPDVWEVHGTEDFPNSEAFMKSRINAQKLLPKLFDGLHVSLSHTWPVWQEMKKNDVVELVQEAGAIVLHREPDPESIPPNEKTVMFHAASDGPMGLCSHVSLYVPGAREPRLKYNMNHMKTLSVEWFVDCIQSFKILDPKM